MTRISDIAKAMNLSEATVSNAFTGKGRMKPQTRDAILACAEKMGYEFHPRKSANAKKHLIIIAENLNNSFVSAILSGIQEEACRLGFAIPVYSLGICDASMLLDPDISRINAEVLKLLSLLDFQPSGILYLAQYARRMDGLLNGLSIPVVSVFCSREDGRAFVHYDDRQGAYLAVNALLDEGRSKIAMISGPIDSIGMYLRSSGYQQALMERHLPYDPRLVRIGDWNEQSGYELTADMLSQGQDIDAIFAQNDFIGFGAVRAILEKGLCIPHNISVIGFDDHLPARLSAPPLTTIRPPFEEMGRTALARILALAEGEEKASGAKNPLLACTLIQRASTLPVK